MPLFKKKVIRDATITSETVLLGEVGYANKHKRVKGAYTPFNMVSIGLKPGEDFTKHKEEYEVLEGYTEMLDQDIIDISDYKEQHYIISESNLGMVQDSSRFIIIKSVKTDLKCGSGTTIRLLGGEYPVNFVFAEGMFDDPFPDGVYAIDFEGDGDNDGYNDDCDFRVQIHFEGSPNSYSEEPRVFFTVSNKRIIEVGFAMGWSFSASHYGDMIKLYYIGPIELMLEAYGRN